MLCFGHLPCLSCPTELEEEHPPLPPPHPASPWRRSTGRCPSTSSSADPHLRKQTFGPAPELLELLQEVPASSCRRSWWWWAERGRTSRASGREPPHLLPLGRRGRVGRRPSPGTPCSPASCTAFHLLAALAGAVFQGFQHLEVPSWRASASCRSRCCRHHYHCYLLFHS